LCWIKSHDGFVHSISNTLFIYNLFYQSDSETSTSDDDDDRDAGTKRGEPNKFDILCDGVNNAMALVHTAMEDVSAAQTFSMFQGVEAQFIV